MKIHNHTFDIYNHFFEIEITSDSKKVSSSKEMFSGKIALVLG
jgi:hypothetical protein